MAVIKLKPTSPGQRGVVKFTRDHLFKGPGFAPLLEPQDLAQQLGERRTALLAETAVELLRAFTADQHRTLPFAANALQLGRHSRRSSAVRNTS